MNERNGQTGLAGEYLVIGELIRKGWAAGRTEGNSKDIDIVAAKGPNMVQIQVKAINGNDVPLKQMRVLEYVTYIVVELSHAHPRYFIIPGAELTADQSNGIYYRSPCGIAGRIRQRELAAFENRWDLLDLPRTHTKQNDLRILT